MTPLATSALEVVKIYQDNTVTPDLLERRLSISRGDAVAALKELANLGFGRFILGRKGHSSRFEKSEQDSGAQENESASLKRTDNVETDEQVYLLRRAVPIQIRVPADLTLLEVERLCKWLHAIAIE